MAKKIPVQLRPFHKTRYAYEKLRVCKHCLQFTVLWEDKCASCGKHTLVPVMEKATLNAKRSMQNERLLSLLITLIAVLFSQTFLQIVVTLVGGLALTAALWFIQRKALPAEARRQLNKLLQMEQRRIHEGIHINLSTASEAMQEDDALGYAILREIATLVQNDLIRRQQVILLQKFILRKDMDLELEPLLLESFDPNLAAYIGEIAKVKRELIKNKTLRYVLLYERQIIQMPQGERILAAVAGAAVRLQTYVDTYPDFITRYVRKLPKDRYLRLYQMVRRHPHKTWNGLRDEVSVVYNEKYRWDPEFQNWD